jgi:hypothetical protein
MRRIGGSLLGNGLVLPLIDFRAPALGIGIAGRELERLIEVGFGVGKFIQAKEGPASPRIGWGVGRIRRCCKNTSARSLSEVNRWFGPLPVLGLFHLSKSPATSMYLTAVLRKNSPR